MTKTMSHFSVLVIGPDVEQQLAPYHEYECTGIDDQYVIDVDVTDEVEAELNEQIDVVRKADGTLAKRNSSEFYTKEGAEKDFSGKPKKEFELPEGATELKMTLRQFLDDSGKSVAEFAESYGGWIQRDGKFYKHTNPNAEWDWYEVGGRWTGWMKLKPGAVGDLGRPGLMTDPAKPGTADSATKGNIDIEGMRDDAAQRAGELWDKARNITPDTWESWEAVRARCPDISEARKAYHDQTAITALSGSADHSFRFHIDDMLAGSRDSFVQEAREKAFVPYAVVKDGQWIAKGQMGWFGCSTDTVSQKDWNKRVNEMIDQLPDNTQITVVDCHI